MSAVFRGGENIQRSLPLMSSGSSYCHAFRVYRTTNNSVQWDDLTSAAVNVEDKPVKKHMLSIFPEQD